MLIQLHKQDIHDCLKTEFVAQNNWSETGLKTIEEVHKWVAEVQARHTIRDDQMWQLCTEDYKTFVPGFAEHKVEVPAKNSN